VETRFSTLALAQNQEKRINTIFLEYFCGHGRAVATTMQSKLQFRRGLNFSGFAIDQFQNKSHSRIKKFDENIDEEDQNESSDDANPPPPVVTTVINVLTLVLLPAFAGWWIRSFLNPF
jgi:hypothetical protein